MNPPLTYVSLISDVDKTLSMVREYWTEARDENEKRKHLNRLNELLDQRWALMQKWDGVVA